MMTKSNRAIFRVTGLLWRESTGRRWIPLTKPVTRSFDVSLICKRHFGDLRRHRAHYDHYDDVIMTILASQITSLTVVYSIVYSGVTQRKHQSSASLTFVREFTGDRWISRTNGQLRGKCFHLMTSSWRHSNVTAHSKSHRFASDSYSPSSDGFYFE